MCVVAFSPIMILSTGYLAAKHSGESGYLSKHQVDAGGGAVDAGGVVIDSGGGANTVDQWTHYE